MSNRKRRRINWSCHLHANDAVVFQNSGEWYIGSVSQTRLRTYSDDYNRIIVYVRGNYVSRSNFNHIFNFGQNHVDQFYFVPNSVPHGENDTGITTYKGKNDRVYKIHSEWPEEIQNHPIKWDILKWRDNLQMFQLVWYRGFHHMRHRIKCIVIDIQQEAFTVQPLYSKVQITVHKNSETIQPIFNLIECCNSALAPNCQLYFMPFREFYTDEYAIQKPLQVSRRIKDTYLGCYCSLKERGSHKKGYIVDVDYDSLNGNNIYCYVEDSGASEDVPFHRFDTHMEYVKWVPSEDIEIINVNNVLHNREESTLPSNELKIQWEHDLRDTELDCLFQLKEADLQMMFHLILRHQKNHAQNRILFALSYLLSTHATHKINPMYTQGHDNYSFDGLKRIIIAKQDLLARAEASQGYDMPYELDRVCQRLSFIMGSNEHSRSSSGISRILKFEDDLLQTPIFNFKALDITLSDDRKTINLSINVNYNSISALNIVSYAATAVNINQIAIRPIMEKLLPDERRFNNHDVYNFSNYAKRSVTKFKKDTTNYQVNDKIVSLKKYQSWIVSQMIKEENSDMPLSDIFTYDLNGSMSYNSIIGFCEKKNTHTYGGFLSLNVGWGKTIIIIELILQQKGSTLICAPLTILDQWKAELSKFAPNLSVAEYYGRNKDQDADVVLTTYGTLRQAINELKEFHRVVFDESHLIKNPQSQRAKACCNVKARNRWNVTATPYDDTNQHLHTQIRMLQIKPFNTSVNILTNDGIFKKLFFSKFRFIHCSRKSLFFFRR